jgi:hypothetical protein
MYEAYYGLRERPFDLTPNPRYLLMTSSHREALSTIQYGLSGRKGITLMLSPAGTVTLVHAALEHPHDNVKVLPDQPDTRAKSSSSFSRSSSVSTRPWRSRRRWCSSSCGASCASAARPAGSRR